MKVQTTSGLKLLRIPWNSGRGGMPERWTYQLFRLYHCNQIPAPTVHVRGTPYQSFLKGKQHRIHLTHTPLPHVQLSLHKEVRLQAPRQLWWSGACQSKMFDGYLIDDGGTNRDPWGLFVLLWQLLHKCVHWMKKKMKDVCSTATFLINCCKKSRMHSPSSQDWLHGF